MGYQEAQDIKTLNYKDLSAGWYPGKEYHLIPDNGASNTDNSIWIEGSLQKMFGYDNVNTSALQSGADVTGMIEFAADSNNLVGVVGTRVYEGLHNAVPTLLSGVTLTNNLQCDLLEYNDATTSLVIGVNGTDAPWSFDGTTLQNLAGSPPTGKWTEFFNGFVFIAQNASNTNVLYFSGLNNPITWDTSTNGDSFIFDGEITGIKALGTQLVVFKRDSIGILTGYSFVSFTKVDRFISGVGCAGGHTIVNARLGGKDGREVLVFLSDSGIYAFDGTQNLIKLSNPIERKFIGSASASRWNENRFSNAVGVFSDKYQWYILGLADGGDSTNDFQMILDLSRPYQTPDEKSAVPHWPMDGVETNAITIRRNSSNLEEVYFGDNTGFVYKLDPAIYNRNGAAYTQVFTSKQIDLHDNWILREANAVFDVVGDYDVEIYVNSDLQSGLGEVATVSTEGAGDLLDTTFIMDTSTLVGNDFQIINAGISNTGRFLQWSIRNPDLNSIFRMQEFELVLKMIGFRSQQ